MCGLLSSVGMEEAVIPKKIQWDMESIAHLFGIEKSKERGQRISAVLFVYVRAKL